MYTLAPFEIYTKIIKYINIKDRHSFLVVFHKFLSKENTDNLFNKYLITERKISINEFKNIDNKHYKEYEYILKYCNTISNILVSGYWTKFNEQYKFVLHSNEMKYSDDKFHMHYKYGVPHSPNLSEPAFNLIYEDNYSYFSLYKKLFLNKGKSYPKIENNLFYPYSIEFHAYSLKYDENESIKYKFRMKDSEIMLEFTDEEDSLYKIISLEYIR